MENIQCVKLKDINGCYKKSIVMLKNEKSRLKELIKRNKEMIDKFLLNSTYTINELRKIKLNVIEDVTYDIIDFEEECQLNQYACASTYGKLIKEVYSLRKEFDSQKEFINKLNDYIANIDNIKLNISCLENGFKLLSI